MIRCLRDPPAGSRDTGQCESDPSQCDAHATTSVPSSLLASPFGIPAGRQTRAIRAGSYGRSSKASIAAVGNSLERLERISGDALGRSPEASGDRGFASKTRA